MAAKKRSREDVARNEQLVRVLHLLQDVQRTGGADLYELSERYGASTRTIRRDFDALESAGIPLKKETIDGSTRMRWRLEVDRTNKVTQLLQASHFLALRMAMAEAQALRHTESLFAVMEDLSDRVERALGPAGRQQLAEIDRCFLSWEKFAWKGAPPDLVVQLVGAISRRRECVVTYRAPSSGNTERSFRVLPLRLLVHNGSVYVHAWREKFKTVLLLNLHRLKKLEVTDDEGEVPDDYDPERLEDSAFGIFLGKERVRFHLRFDAWARPYIEERIWHPSQELRPLEDGGAELTFTCTPSYEVTNWVASWQQHVEVLEPASLRDDLHAWGRWLVERYGPPPGRADG